MPAARCRILENGQLINKNAPFADAGLVLVKIRKSTRVLDIEWAPPECPETIGYPFRKRYHVDLGANCDESLGRRLHNLGFPPEPAMEDGIRRFQQTYLQSPTGAVADVQAQLVPDHDDGTLPPVPPPGLQRQVQLASFTPSAQGSNQLVGAPQNTPTAPVGPPAPGGTQPLGAVRPDSSVISDIVIDWGTRYRTRPKESTVRSSSFWLDVHPPAPFPVAFGVVPGVGNWDTAPLTSFPLTPETKGAKTSVKASAAGLAGASFVRLDVDIKATIGTVTKTVLAFKQLYSIDGDGRLKAQLWVIDDFSFQQPASGGPPVRAPGTSTVAKRGTREGTGLHPLLRHQEQVVPAGRRKTLDLDLRIARIFINAEFVDATELWWALHPQETKEDIFNPNAVPQYLNPTLGARCEHLRVLVWTGGGLPMIWFAVIPDAALSTLDDGSANVVFFRPPAGINSFAYTPNAEGFANPNHGSTTMSMLARYLLSARPLAELGAAGISDARTLRQFADQIQPNTPNPTSPNDPMQLDPAVMLPAAFRPVGLESSLNQASSSHVLLLPLGADAGDPSYEAARARGLKELSGSALRLLWNTCAVARDTVKGPDINARQLWLAGHSFGNGTMMRCLDNNTDVDRIMTFSATPRHTVFNQLIGAIARAVEERTKSARTLNMFVVAAPDMIDEKNDKGENEARERRPISSETDRKLRRTGASITLIPDFDQQFDYYRLSPATSMNPFLRHLLGMWTNAEIENSAKTPHAWRFLFFHEYAVYGEVRVHGRFFPSFRSFFLEALGPPAPRPPA